jgi:hypothetical protein
MAAFHCDKCSGDFYVDTAGMNCPNCGIWLEGAQSAPPFFCDHANENPMICRCPENCYCKTHTCKVTKEPTDEERAALLDDGPVLLWSEPAVHVTGESGDRELEKKVVEVFRIAFQLWQSRQKKYGRGNIARTGSLGCYIRSEDKMARLRGVYVQRKGDMPDESISDSWLDLVNYAVMGYMCHHKLWPGLEQADWYGETNVLRPNIDVRTQPGDYHSRARANGAIPGPSST